MKHKQLMTMIKILEFVFSYLITLWNVFYISCQAPLLLLFKFYPPAFLMVDEPNQIVTEHSIIL